MATLVYLATHLWWPFIAVAVLFGIGVGIGALLNRGTGEGR